MGSRAVVPTVESAPRRLGHRPVLDGIRGVAILLVMLMHTQILANGYIGVDIFFGLSGFLITTLLLEESERRGGISLRAFYERRARRLLPALAVILAACVIVNETMYTLTGWPIGDKLLTTALFVNNWMVVLEHAKLGSLAPTWSLGQEEQFYLLWPLLLVAALRLRLDRRLIAVALALMIVTLLCIQPLVLPRLSSHAEYFAPFDRACELLFGALGAVVWHWRLIPGPLAWSGRIQRLRPLAAVLSHRWRVAAGWGLTLAFVWLMFNHTLPERTVYLSAVGLTVPLIVNLLGAPSSLLARAIALRPLRWIGRISYGLYLYHLLVRNVLYHYDPDLPIYQSALITFAASISLAALSWYLLESRFVRRRTAPAAARKPAARRRLSLLPAR